MKIRTCFVSNSSTSSFCCYGAEFETRELEELLGASEDLGEIIDPLCGKLGLSYYSLEEYEADWVVGLSYNRMEKTETRDQFEKRATDLVRQFTGKKTKCEMQQGTYPS